MNLDLIWYPSPNFDSRPNNILPDCIVLHHTALPSAQSALRVLTDPNNGGNPVSAHYLVGRDGKIYQLVKDQNRAWHAGISYWRGRSGLNAYSIGIELDNTGEENFAPALMQSLITLMLYLIPLYNISKDNILSHSEIAPNRKIDPSYYFNWKSLANSGIGYFPLAHGSQKKLFELNDKSDGVIILQEKLSFLGFKIEVSGIFNEQTLHVVNAFNRRYCPQTFIDNIYNAWTDDADQKLNDLIQQQKQ